MEDGEGNPRDTEAPDSSPPREPPKAPIDEPEAPVDPPENRLSRQVPIGLLFVAATAAVLVFLAIVAVVGYFALSPRR